MPVGEGFHESDHAAASPWQKRRWEAAPHAAVRPVLPIRRMAGPARSLWATRHGRAAACREASSQAKYGGHRPPLESSNHAWYTRDLRMRGRADQRGMSDVGVSALFRSGRDLLLHARKLPAGVLPARLARVELLTVGGPGAVRPVVGMLFPCRPTGHARLPRSLLSG